MMALNFLMGAAGVYLWWSVYRALPDFASWLTYGLLPIKQGSHLGSSVEFFLYDTPKVMMLLFLVVFGVGILRSFFTPEKTRAFLSGKSEFAGNILAALLGIVTPFCSCSAVPLFIGFVTAGVPLGVTFSFLIAAPMVNEIALGLLYGLLGWKVAAIYMGTGLFIAISAGWIIGRLKLEGHIEDWVTQTDAPAINMEEEKLTWNDRIVYGWDAVKEMIGKVWIYVILG
ncbi:MAG: permease, partial [Proteobacteria bacterium]|nr:permease [Pseudomonadota bacterium]